MKSLPPDISSRGFTLIEGVMAVGILSIGFLSILGVITFGLRIIKNNQEETLKMFNAQALIEQEIAKPYNEVNGIEIRPGLKEVDINGLIKTYISQ